MIQAKIRATRAGDLSLLLNWRTIVILFLVLAALGIRLLYANQPPLDFHATRQYRSLLIARAYYFETQASIPGWEKEVARLNQDRQGILEPPIMEALVVLGYRIFGGERFWIPRLFSSLLWIIGSGFLYLIARRITGERGALFSLVFYLFLPFAVIASRSFQPDPLMIMLLVASLYCMLEYYESSSWFWWVSCTLLSAAAVFVKPVSVFMIMAVFAALAIQQHGFRSWVRNPRTLLFLPLTLLPAFLFYLYGIFFTGVMRNQAQASFLPQLLITSFFWRGWLNNIREVVGFPILIASLIGVLLAQRGVARLLLVALWSGYVLFCLAFSYQVATHDYYHLQLIPIVALSLGPLANFILERLQEMNPQWYWHMGIASIFSFALLLSLIVTRSELAFPSSDGIVQEAQEIGTQVHHSTQTIYLASDYGLSLEYHGELSGKPWPLTSDLEWEKLAGVQVLDARDRFASWFAGDSPQYFIVQDLNEWEQQPDLRKFLSERYPVLAQNEHYIIFALNGK